jgi:putative FmdB family regulatory protein
VPTYEYKCESCGHTFEKFQSMRDKPIEKCPKCEGRVQRLISGGGGIIFKGSGFYAMDLAMPYGTDYANSNAPACGRDRPCCGRDTPCDKRPCE